MTRRKGRISNPAAKQVASVEMDTRLRAATVLRPTVGAACAIAAIEPAFKDAMPIEDLAAELADQVRAVHGGSLARPEGLLISQAHTLDLLFNRLTRRAMAADMLPQFEASMKMALRAQSQCARTLEVLAAMKNPPVVIARQANVTTGPQQNNFGISRAENQNKPTELLEKTDGERLDAGTTAQAVPGNSTLEAMDAKHRAENAGRKGEVSEEPRPG